MFYPCTVETTLIILIFLTILRSFINLILLVLRCFFLYSRFKSRPTGDDGFGMKAGTVVQLTIQNLKGRKNQGFGVSPDDIKIYRSKISYPLPYSNFNELYSSSIAGTNTLISAVIY